jgi:hypothetical protein
MPFQSGYDIIAYPRRDVKLFLYGMACSQGEKGSKKVAMARLKKDNAMREMKVAFFNRGGG